MPLSEQEDVYEKPCRLPRLVLEMRSYMIFTFHPVSPRGRHIWSSPGCAFLYLRMAIWSAASLLFQDENTVSVTRLLWHRPDGQLKEHTGYPDRLGQPTQLRSWWIITHQINVVVELFGIFILDCGYHSMTDDGIQRYRYNYSSTSVNGWISQLDCLESCRRRLYFWSWSALPVLLLCGTHLILFPLSK